MFGDEDNGDPISHQGIIKLEIPVVAQANVVAILKDFPSWAAAFQFVLDTLDDFDVSTTVPQKKIGHYRFHLTGPHALAAEPEVRFFLSPISRN